MTVRALGETIWGLFGVDKLGLAGDLNKVKNNWKSRIVERTLLRFLKFLFVSEKSTFYFFLISKH